MSRSHGTVNCEPPPIASVPTGVQRPLWSVMIPTFNCANYLRLTLESVLQQDPGPDLMQIEVIDDCSTKDDPEAVVRELGAGRVAFYRQPTTGGAVANFNTCIERSRGDLVHILHGDDLVLDGYYRTVAEMAQAHPDCALYATRCFHADAQGYYIDISKRFPQLESAPGSSLQGFYENSPLQFASVTIRRSFYEQEGGFLPQLVHVADWEMWTRAVSRGKGMVGPSILGVYRVFAENDTGRLMRTAENLADCVRLGALLRGRHPEFNAAEFSNRIFFRAIEQEDRFAKRGDAQAEGSNRAFRRSLNSWTNLPFRLKRFVIRAAKRL